MKVIVGVCIKKDEKILMVQEAKEKAYKKWNFPMGRLDEGESIFGGAIREAKEETGYDVKLTSIVSIQNYIREDNVKIAFNAEIVSGELSYDLEEVLDVQWISIKDLENMSEEELRAYDSTMDFIKDVKANREYPLEVLKDI